MKIAIPVILVLLACAAQNSLAFFMSIASVKPDFVLVLVALMGLVYGSKIGLLVGFFSGLIIDLSGMGVFGFHTFCFTIIGVLAGSTQKSVFEDNFLLPVIVVFFSTFIMQILWYVCLWFNDYLLTNYAMIILFIFAKPLYNVVLTAPMFLIFKRIKALIDWRWS